MISQVKVGPIVYSVRNEDGIHDTDENGQRIALNGDVDYSTAIIRLDQNQQAVVIASALWHEIVHAILAQAGHERHDENHVIALGYGITQVMRDNPDFVRYVISEEER